MTLWVPAPRVAVDTLATPLPSRVAVKVPPPVPLMTNVTVPVGVPVAGGTALTVAVKVTVCPYLDGSGAEVTVVALDGWVTTLWVVVPVEDEKLPSPL